MITENENKLLDVIEEKNQIILVANHKIIQLEKKIEDKNIKIMRLLNNIGDE